MKMQKKHNIKKVSFNIDKDLHWKAKQLALDNKTSITELYNKFIKEGIEKLEKEQKKLQDY